MLHFLVSAFPQTRAETIIRLAAASDDTPRIAFMRSYTAVQFASPSGTTWHIEQAAEGDAPCFSSMVLISTTYGSGLRVASAP